MNEILEIQFKVLELLNEKSRTEDELIIELCSSFPRIKSGTGTDKLNGQGAQELPMIKQSIEGLVNKQLIIKQTKASKFSITANGQAVKDKDAIGKFGLTNGNLTKSKKKSVRSKQRKLYRKKYPKPNNQADRILAQLPTMSPEQLFSLWLALQKKLRNANAFRYHNSSREILKAIEKTWDHILSTSSDYFEWPGTEIGDNNGNPSDTNFRDQGMLGALGYRVGRTSGEPASVRRQILDQCFSSVLPPIDSKKYWESWSTPSTPLRLKRIAVEIAELAKRFKRRSNASEYRDAIADWEEDLEYLYTKYYLPMFAATFRWPNTSL